MLDSITISGDLLVAFTVWVGLLILSKLFDILYPNYIIKRIIASRGQKPPKDNITRFTSLIWFTIWTFVLLHILGIV